MIWQKEIQLPSLGPGVHLITKEVIRHLEKMPENGILHIFLRHTSAGLTLNENADPSVRYDVNDFFDFLVPESWPDYTHIMEGVDDMPAHIKSVLFGQSVSIPVTNHELNLGTWQGIYLGEFRNQQQSRKIILTLYF